MSTNPAASAALVAAHHARLQALLDGDIDALGQVVAEDMVYVSSFGKIQTRPEVIAALTAGTLKIERMDSRDITTRIYGDIGILIYAADSRIVDGSTVVEGKTRSTTVYAQREGRWQMVSQHQSRIE